MPPFYTLTRHGIVWDLAVQFFFFKFDELVHVRTKNTLLFSACKHDLMASLIRKCN